MSILTEEQAKKRTCPFIRYCENPRGVTLDRDSALYEHSKCLASECMGWIEVDDTFAPRPIGYCGLVGRAS